MRWSNEQLELFLSRPLPPPFLLHLLPTLHVSYIEMHRQELSLSLPTCMCACLYLCMYVISHQVLVHRVETLPTKSQRVLLLLLPSSSLEAPSLLVFILRIFASTSLLLSSFSLIFFLATDRRASVSLASLH